jgi:hypothetical protein
MLNELLSLLQLKWLFLAGGVAIFASPFMPALGPAFAAIASVLAALVKTFMRGIEITLANPPAILVMMVCTLYGWHVGVQTPAPTKPAIASKYETPPKKAPNTKVVRKRQPDDNDITNFWFWR